VLQSPPVGVERQLAERLKSVSVGDELAALAFFA